MIDVEELTISEAQNAFENGTYTCRELTAAYLDRIEKFDKNGPKINSTMAMSKTALMEAEALDNYPKEHGKLFGSLHGIPVLVKDQADTKGIITTYSSFIAKDNVPNQDATVVKKLKEAGAIILGKTTMSEWASTWFSYSTATKSFTHNPYKLGYDPSGSSSGTGSAIAANFALIGVGEDTGGSIRIPSSFCNLVGLRPTVGLISRTGFMPLIAAQDTPGPMTRTVTDCALMLDAMVGYDPKDEYTAVAYKAGTPKGCSYANLNPEMIKRARIGVVPSLLGSEKDPSCRVVNQVIGGALARLEAAGTTLVDIAIPDLQHYMTFTPTYISSSRHDINKFLATKPHLPDDIASFVPVKPVHPTFDFTSAIANSFTSPEQDPDYLKRILHRQRFVRLVGCIMAEHNLDAIALPDVQIPSPQHEDATNGRFPSAFSFPVNTLFASQLRWPAITVPAGFTTEEGPWSGLPVGLELVSWEFTEHKLLELAFGVEALLNGRRPPKISDLA